MSALAYAPPGTLEGCPGGAVVSGSRDTTVAVWNLQDPQVPVQRLEGHQYQVRVGRCGRGWVLNESADAVVSRRPCFAAHWAPAPNRSTDAAFSMHLAGVGGGGGTRWHHRISQPG